ACLDHPDAGPRRRRSPLPAGEGGAAFRPRAVRRQDGVRESGPASGRGAASDAIRERHHARLDPHGGHRRRRARLLTPPTVGREGVGAGRGDDPERARGVRTDLRLDARQGTRSFGRCRRDCGLSRNRRCLRAGSRGLRRALRRPERARLRRASTGRRLGSRDSSDGAVRNGPVSTQTAPAAAASKRYVTLFGGIRPYERAWLSRDVVAGITLAALAIPEVMGYTKIAGTPVITGLYTILIPVLAFAIFGSSRHLVVGGDSA